MNATLIQFLRGLRGSYWFVPTVMVVGAIAVSEATLLADQRLEAGGWAGLSHWLPAHSTESRALLSTIAGSMIGVAGVTFSMTLVSVSFAASQYGPRLIGNFMRDRGNQLTLGTFVATFVYALLVLRRVRDGTDEVERFVPQLSVLVALGLTLASIGVLVYFVHHVPETINVGRIAAAIGRELQGRVGEVFVDGLGREEAERQQPPSPRTWQADDVAWLPSPAAGYLQALNEERLLQLAEQHDLELRLEYRSGDFATSGVALLGVRPAGRAERELLDELAACFAIGPERTVDQDVLFLVDQLVEITARALSPGINDPFTAVACLNWLRAALCAAVGRAAPLPVRCGDDGRTRLIAHPVTFERLAERALGGSRQYVAADRNASLACLAAIGAAAAVAAERGLDARRDLMLAHARRLGEACEARLPLEVDRRLVSERIAELERATRDPAALARLMDAAGWLGGTG